MFDQTEGQWILENGDCCIYLYESDKIRFQTKVLSYPSINPSLINICKKRRFTSTKDWYKNMIFSFRLSLFTRNWGLA